MSKPLICVQHDWDLVVDDARKAHAGKTKFWMSSYSQDVEDGVHTFCEVSNDSQTVYNILDDSKIWEVQSKGQSRLMASCSKTGAAHQIYAPSARFISAAEHVYDVDISSLALRGVSCTSEGHVRVWDAITGQVHRELQGHRGEVQVCKWFPSGEVVISAGADMSIKIWSVEIGKCAKTLTGHTRAVTGVSLIGSGRTFVTTSKDGTVRLWDCSAGLVQSMALPIPAALNCILMSGQTTEGQGKGIVVGGEDGFLREFDCRTNAQVMSFNAKSPINACAHTRGDNEILIGRQDGIIQLLDRRVLGSSVGARELGATQITKAPIYSLRLGEGTYCDMWVTNGEGHVLHVPMESFESQASSITLSLTGVDCEPVYALCLGPDMIFTSSCGGVFQYRVH